MEPVSALVGTRKLALIIGYLVASFTAMPFTAAFNSALVMSLPKELEFSWVF